LICYPKFCKCWVLLNYSKSCLSEQSHWQVILGWKCNLRLKHIFSLCHHFINLFTNILHWQNKILTGSWEISQVIVQQYANVHVLSRFYHTLLPCCVALQWLINWNQDYIGCRSHIQIILLIMYNTEWPWSCKVCVELYTYTWLLLYWKSVSCCQKY
jgi:hypothetical protein